jgi:hypothetical protein
MRRTITAFVLAVAVVAGGAVEAKQKTIAGNWTLTTEHLPLKMVLAQDHAAVTGTLDYPHGAAFHLTGEFRNNTLTFSGDSAGENFTIHIQSSGVLGADGSLVGAINAHFVEMNDAHEVVRTRDQVMTWTATRAATS